MDMKKGATKKEVGKMIKKSEVKDKKDDAKMMKSAAKKDMKQDKKMMGNEVLKAKMKKKDCKY